MSNDGMNSSRSTPFAITCLMTQVEYHLNRVLTNLPSPSHSYSISSTNRFSQTGTAISQKSRVLSMAERTAEVYQLRGQVLDGVRARAQEIKRESARLKGKVGIITGVGPESGIGVSVLTGNKNYVNVMCRQLLLNSLAKKACHPWGRPWEYAER